MVLYGSIARDTAAPESDVDLLYPVGLDRNRLISAKPSAVGVGGGNHPALP